MGRDGSKVSQNVLIVVVDIRSARAATAAVLVIDAAAAGVVVVQRHEVAIDLVVELGGDVELEVGEALVERDREENEEHEYGQHDDGAGECGEVADWIELYVADETDLDQE